MQQLEALQLRCSICRLQMPRRPHGNCTKSLAPLACSCDGIPTAYTQKELKQLGWHPRRRLQLFPLHERGPVNPEHTGCRGDVLRGFPSRHRLACETASAQTELEAAAAATAGVWKRLRLRRGELLAPKALMLLFGGEL